MSRSLLVFIFLWSTGTVVLAQATSIDSTAIKLLIDRAEIAGDTSATAAVALYREAIEASRAEGMEIWHARALYGESYYHYGMVNFEGVIENCTKAAGIYASHNDLLAEAKCYNRIGLAWMSLNKFQPALQALFKALELIESLPNKDLAGKVHNNMSLVYESMKDWDNAQKHLMLSIPYKVAVNDTMGLAVSYANMANQYYYQQKYEEALPYFYLSTAYYTAMDNHARLAANATNIGNMFTQMNQIDSAIFYLSQAYKYLTPPKDDLLGEWCITVVGMGSAWLKKGDVSKAAFYLDKCDACEEQISEFVFLKDLYGLKSEYYKEIGEPVKALNYLEQAYAAKDSINLESQIRENQKIAIRYEFTKKAREDSLQYQLNISKQEVATASYKNRMYFVLVILLLVAAVAATILVRLRRIQEKKRNMALEAMRNNIAGDLHDDIGSTLSSIQIMSSLALSQSEKDSALRQQLTLITDLADKVSGGIREIVWSVNPAHDKIQAVTLQLRKLAADILGTKDIVVNFTEDLRQHKTELNPQKRKELIMIFKESLNNARKYSGTDRVDINIKQKSHELTVLIKDYGCGFDLQKVKRGNGLNNIERRAEDMGAKLEIYSKPDKGTSLLLKIPLP